MFKEDSLIILFLHVWRICIVLSFYDLSEHTSEYITKILLGKIVWQINVTALYLKMVKDPV